METGAETLTTADKKTTKENISKNKLLEKPKPGSGVNTPEKKENATKLINIFDKLYQEQKEKKTPAVKEDSKKNSLEDSLSPNKAYKISRHERAKRNLESFDGKQLLADKSAEEQEKFINLQSQRILQTTFSVYKKARDAGVPEDAIEKNSRELWDGEYGNFAAKVAPHLKSLSPEEQKLFESSRRWEEISESHSFFALKTCEALIKGGSEEESEIRVAKIREEYIDSLSENDPLRIAYDNYRTATSQYQTYLEFQKPTPLSSASKSNEPEEIKNELNEINTAEKGKDPLHLENIVITEDKTITAEVTYQEVTKKIEISGKVPEGLEVIIYDENADKGQRKFIAKPGEISEKIKEKMELSAFDKVWMETLARNNFKKYAGYVKDDLLEKMISTFALKKMSYPNLINLFENLAFLIPDEDQYASLDKIKWIKSILNSGNEEAVFKLKNRLLAPECIGFQDLQKTVETKM